MSDDNVRAMREIVADIVAEKRARANEIEGAAGRAANQFQRELIADLRREADRIEAAAKREFSRTAEKSSAVGNAKAMLEAINKVLGTLLDVTGAEEFDAMLIDNCMRYIRAALSAPARNCDVGTAEDQTDRFFDFCMGHTVMSGMCDTNCPCARSKDGCHCVCKWMQLPYEESSVEKPKR